MLWIMLTNDRSILQSPLLSVLSIVCLVQEVALVIFVGLDVELVGVLLRAIAVQRSQGTVYAHL